MLRYVSYYSTFVRNLHTSTHMDAKKIQELISGYGLMDTLQDRLQVAVVGGVARSTIYKAFQTGPETPRTKIVLQVAQQVIADHERTVTEAIMATA